MNKLIIGLLVLFLLSVSVGCGPKAETPPPKPVPYMPSPEYRFSPPYSAAFDLESSRGFTVIDTGAVYPSYEWSSKLKGAYPVLKEYRELPQTGQISLLDRSSRGVARLVLTSTSEKDHEISIEAKVGEWLSKVTPEGIGIAMPVNTVHLESREITTVDIEIEAKESVPSGVYFLDVLATIEGYRYEAVFWLLVP